LEFSVCCYDLGLTAPPREDRRAPRPDPPAVHARAPGADRLVAPGSGARDRPRQHRSGQPAHGPEAHGLLDPPPSTGRGAAPRPRTAEGAAAPALLTIRQALVTGRDVTWQADLPARPACQEAPLCDSSIPGPVTSP